MPPRAPVIWTHGPARGERIRKRLDERHRDLTREARARGASYRGSRAAASDPETVRLRADFLNALGRLAAFESASSSFLHCRFEIQMRAYADDLARDYFQLWQLLARRGTEVSSEDEGSAERMDHFAVQLGRLEGMADALLIAGRNVRLFPPPHIPWLPVATGA
ncbi:MAG: hypothetical protein KGN00_00435 [Chloroflexota bacterium]|nr:hypothetical protein [Chloroflexota bacterium]MDE3192127.1 hypothetical protein [Chloroflexota bacterium]